MQTFTDEITAIYDGQSYHVRPSTPEGGSGLLFWRHPDSAASTDRIGKITAHGQLVGSEQPEMAWYTTNEAGGLENRLKLLAACASTPLVLTGATGLARSSGQLIKLGEGVRKPDGTFGPVSPVKAMGSFDVVGTYKANGVSGVSGTFESQDGKVVTVTNGLITDIT